MKGFRTIVTGLLVALAPTALNHLASIDWTQYVSPNAAMLISGGLMIGLRAITSTPLGRK